VKALTIQQPYASLIADGAKFVENRTWSTSYRGLIGIHASKSSSYISRAELKGYPTGCVVAIARLVACISLDDLKRDFRTAPGRMIATGLTVGDIFRHRYTEGPYCWILTEVHRLPEPVPTPGALGLWEWRRTEEFARAHDDRDDRLAGSLFGNDRISPANGDEGNQSEGLHRDDGMQAETLRNRSAESGDRRPERTDRPTARAARCRDS
jgi:hypothetical protein